MELEGPVECVTEEPLGQTHKKVVPLVVIYYHSIYFYFFGFVIEKFWNTEDQANKN